MTVVEEVALQLNLGHTPTEIIRKHYTSMLQSERETILDALCQRALHHRTELELYLDFERGQMHPSNPNYQRAKEIYEKNKLNRDY